MDFELRPVSDAGRIFVDLCESHQDVFSSRAAAHDRDGKFPTENFTDLARSGVMAGTVPAELGGLGVSDLRDQVVGINRLARGDGSTAIAANMHIGHVRGLSWTWRQATAAGQTARADALARILRGVVNGSVIISAVGSEAGSPQHRPMAEARREGDVYRLNGRKSFATICPIATLLSVVFRIPAETGEGWRIAASYINRNTPGVEIQGNWDALGMRASGSNDIVFRDCPISARDVLDIGPWGVMTDRVLALAAHGIIGLLGAFLGIAESARAVALRQITARGRGGESGVQHQVAEMEAALASARATLERAATHANELLYGSTTPATRDQVVLAAKEGQLAKMIVARDVIDVVDRAMTLSGGSGYMAASPLARMYRDVRAAPFMQPFSPLEIFEFVGRASLGIEVT